MNREEMVVRSFELNRQAIDEEKRTVELTFSSEEPYLRWFGYEILSHRDGAIDLKRLNSGSPLLWNHNTDEQIGVVEKAWIENGKGKAIVRFGKSARAEEIYQDVLDGIRKNVSVGYMVHEMKLKETRDDGTDVYEVTRWEPLEISIVSVPADITVGVGRSLEAKINEIKKNEKKEDKMIETKVEVREQETVDVEKIKEEARKAEATRVKEILAMGERFGKMDMARTFVNEGKSVDEFRAALLEEMGAKPVKNVNPEIGMSEKEKRQFSFLRLINALANPADRKAQEAAAFEFECSRAVADQLRKSPNGAFIPYDVLTRDLTVGGVGGNLVATGLATESFIEMLRNKLIVRAAGAQILGGLVGDLAIPRQTGGATAYWVSEGGALTESDVTIDQVALTPKTVGAFTDISRKMLKQSSLDVETFIRRDLATTLALAIDYASIAGDGASNNPVGILNTSGIGLVVGGTDGAAPTWAHIVQLESEVAADNADIGTLAYLTNAKVRGKLKQTEKATGTGLFVWDGDSLNGYPAYVSNQVPSNLTKGAGTNLSAIIFGNFADLLIGEWGTIDITVDPYSQSTTGTVRVVAFQDVDVAVRHPESFAAMKDAITA